MRVLVFLCIAAHTLVAQDQPAPVLGPGPLGAWPVVSQLPGMGRPMGDRTTPLAPGMGFALEPGIYLSDESLGVRIEDDVLVTPTGSEWLSAGAPRTTGDVERVMREGRGGRR
jgi:peptidase M24-like protein